MHSWRKCSLAILLLLAACTSKQDAVVEVRPGKTTDLLPVEFALPAGNASITGRILPASSAARVTLLYEGKEQVSRQTDPDGSYEFTGLAAGRYTIVVRSPGYAEDAVEMNLAEGRLERRTIRLLCVTMIEGVDWSRGKIRARGIGMPPPDASSPTIRREMSKRAALADAQRNLLRILDRIEVVPGRTLRSFLGEGEYVERIQGFIRGYHIVGERERDDGVMEVELEFPLTGPGGLSSQVLF